MKDLIFPFTVLLLLTQCEKQESPPPENHRLQQVERQRDQLQEQLQDQQSRTGKWIALCLILGIGCPAALLLGAALGSKTKRDADQRK